MQTCELILHVDLWCLQWHWRFCGGWHWPCVSVRNWRDGISGYL